MAYEKITVAGKFVRKLIMNRKPLPPSNLQGRRKSANAENKGKNRIKSYKNAQRLCTDYITCNIEPNSVFITLTFDKTLYFDLIFDIKKSNKRFEKFIPKLKNYLKDYKALKYLKFLDFDEKDNSIHFHVIFFNLPNISQKILTKLWKFGFVDIEFIEEYQKSKNIDSSDGLSAYLLKSYTNEILYSAMNSPKLFSPSNSLSNSVSITNNQTKEFLKIKEELKTADIINQNTNDDLYLGKIKKQIFKLKDNSLYKELLNI